MGAKRKMPSMWIVVPAIAAVIAVLYPVVHDYYVAHDTASAWTAVHNAMTDVRALIETAKQHKGAAGGYSSASPNPYAEAVNQYSVAVIKLRSQLRRVGSDPLAASISSLFDANRDPAQWQSENFRQKFDELAEQVADKAH